jgi:hypothetical protein
MVARTRSEIGLQVTFIREGEEPETQVARDGERACHLAVVLLAKLGTLQHGDCLLVAERK